MKPISMEDHGGIPDSYIMGERFEKYVRDYIFTKDYFTVVDKTHNYQSNLKDFIESTINPDYKLRDNKTRQEFYLEIKFRTNLYNGKIHWCDYNQLLRYRQFEKLLPLFVVIGLGGFPDMPAQIFVLPLSESCHTDLFLSVVGKFEIEPTMPMTSKELWSVVNITHHRTG